MMFAFNAVTKVLASNPHAKFVTIMRVYGSTTGSFRKLSLSYACCRLILSSTSPEMTDS